MYRPYIYIYISKTTNYAIISSANIPLRTPRRSLGAGQVEQAPSIHGSRFQLGYENSLRLNWLPAVNEHLFRSVDSAEAGCRFKPLAPLLEPCQSFDNVRLLFKLRRTVAHCTKWLGRNKSRPTSGDMIIVSSVEMILLNFFTLMMRLWSFLLLALPLWMLPTVRLTQHPEFATPRPYE